MQDFSTCVFSFRFYELLGTASSRASGHDLDSEVAYNKSAWRCGLEICFDRWAVKDFSDHTRNTVFPPRKNSAFFYSKVPPTPELVLAAAILLRSDEFRTLEQPETESGKLMLSITIAELYQ
jgi:hypothetical protein